MKTITVRVDDNVYNILKKAADGERRTISNFIENASLSYLTNEIYVSDHEMAEIMKEMSKNMQVIAITHLPQIAAKGNQHYRVFKDDSGKTTQTHINLLDREERIWEVAQMLSGENVTEVALGNAKELLKSE